MEMKTFLFSSQSLVSKTFKCQCLCQWIVSDSVFQCCSGENSINKKTIRTEKQWITPVWKGVDVDSLWRSQSDLIN